jgi:hypothetical protein
MIELVAGALLAASVLAFVLEPLFHPAPPAGDESAEPDRASLVRAEALVARIAKRPPVRCAACGEIADGPAAFCPRCGARL